MNKPLLALLFLAGCSGGDSEGANQAAPAAPPGARPAGGGTLTSLTGLYEGGAVDPKNQLCMIEEEGGSARFGLVVWGSDLHSCSGSGTARRDGAVLRLAMAGDEACAIEAKVSGTTISLPAAIPDGCAYYCGAGATMKDVTFSQTGAAADDAAKAKDLVGEPLCGGAG